MINISRTKCIWPYVIELKDHRGAVRLPCGKCVACKTRLTRDWIFRIQKEEDRSTSAYFVTLTYNNDNIPLTPYFEYTLKKEDVQYFIKRLRYIDNGNKYGKSKVKYFAVGEYGTRRGRPHYHLILFNVNDINSIYKAWEINGKQRGMIHIDEVNKNTIAYTIGYVNKPPRWRTDLCTWEPEFRLASSKIGDNYLTDNIVNYHKKDLKNRYKVVHKDGSIGNMPRYYKDKIYTKAEKKAIMKNVQEVVNDWELKASEKLLREQGITLAEYQDTVNNYRIHQFFKHSKKRKHD